MCKGITTLAVAAAVLTCVSGAQADVFNMPDGLTNLEIIPVGNPGNPGDARYPSGGVPSFGSVDYSYNIGKYELTAGQYTEFLNAVAFIDVYGLYSTKMWTSSCGCKIQRHHLPSGVARYTVAGDWADRPVNYVSWGDSARFANWLHNGQPTGAQDLSTTEDGAYFLDGAMTDGELMSVAREPNAAWAIPTGDEWHKAAYHKNDGVTGNYFDYPTSSDETPSKELVDPDPGNNATFHGGSTIGSPYYRTEAGAHENSDSPYSTFDQGGNVWEWNDAVLPGSYRLLRGGSYFFDRHSLHAATRDFLYPSSENCDVGFRVAEVPEPVTLTLLTFGGLLAGRRRR
ncbi:MAG: formylglycine-generating enzyme family protein [bacterium]|nr:formylglycine-generating enzyme family protein [bacterium]